MVAKMLRVVGVLATGLIATSMALAADLPTDEKRGTLPIEVQKAVDRGLAYLVAQQRDDGSFGKEGYSRNTAVVGLCGMAFMASGSKPGDGRYGKQIERCAHYLTARATDNGLITVPESGSHGPMYDHAFATLFLAKCYGVAEGDLRKKVLPVVENAVMLIIKTQNDQGGWRYQPERVDEADISVTVSQMMALTAAKNAGIDVPKDVLDRSLEYVKKSQNADGGFRYLLRGGSSAFPRSAAGVAALYAVGHEGPEIEKGLTYLMRHRADDRASHYFNGHYYAAQAMWRAGGERWKKWYPAVCDDLTLPDSQHEQREDGSWMDAVGPHYATATACIILQTPRSKPPVKGPTK